MLNFELLGMLYAAGSVKTGKNYRISLQTKRRELAQAFSGRLSAFGNVKADRVSKKVTVVKLVGRKEMETLLKGFEINPPFDKERIPSQILDSSEKRISFLRGFFEGKASIYPEKRLIRVSGKKEQLGEIRKLLEQEGIKSSIYSTGKYPSLYIEGKSRCESFRKIGFLTKEKNDKLENAFGWLTKKG